MGSCLDAVAGVSFAAQPILPENRPSPHVPSSLPVLTPPSLTNQRTSVMLRNLPSGFTCRQLLNLLDSLGFLGRYDFVYQPVNFETMTCLSHAFVNLVSPADAE